MRTTSLFLGFLSLVGPSTWAYIQSGIVAEGMERQQGWVCGTPLLGIFFLAAAITAVLSIVAFTFGMVAFKRLSSPRPFARKLELAVLLLPLCLAIASQVRI